MGYERKIFLGRSSKVKVEVAELEDLLGPDDVNVDFRRILEEARDENGCAIFTTLSTDGRVERTLETKIRRLLQVMDGGGTAEGWMEFGKVDVEFLERLMEPGNMEIFPRYILKYLDKRRQ